MKVVFHVDELTKLSEARHNIKNLITAEPETEIVLVVNGEAIQGYLLPAQLNFIRDFPKVAYHACHNAMKAHHIEAQELANEIKVVPAGVVDLIQLQEAGFAYIKP